MNDDVAQLQEKKRRTPRTLSFAQKHEIGIWMMANEERLNTERPTFSELARQLSKTLGFEISEQTIPEVASAVKVTWERVRRMGVNPRGYAARLNDLEPKVETLETKVRQLEADNAVLRAALVRILTSLGEKVPSGLVVIDNGKIPVTK